MGIVIRQGLKASVITYIGAFLGYLVWLRLYPLWLNPEEVGLLRALFDAVILISPFLQGGVASLVVKYSPYLTTRIENEQRFLGFALAVPIVLTLIGGVVLAIFKDSIFAAYSEKSPLFAEFIWYIVPLAFFSVYIQLVEALIRIKLRIVVPRIIRELLVRGLNLLVVWGYFAGIYGLSQLVASLVLVNILHLVLLSVYYVRLRGKFIVPNLGIVKTRFLKPLLDYTGFMILGSGSGSLVAKIDSLMTAYLLGLTETGVYGIAFLIATVIELPRRVFNSLITPLVAKAYKAKNFSLLQTYYHRSSLNLSIISVTLFLGIWSNLDLIYSFVPDREVYESGKWVVFFIGIGKVFDMSMGINAELIQNSKYYRWNLYLTPVLAVLAVCTNLIFIPLYGISGAALATLISVALYNITRFYMVKRAMKITPFKASNVWVALLAIVAFIVTEYFQIGNVYTDFLFNGVVVVFIFLLPIWYFSLSPDFNNFIRGIARRFGINLTE